MGSSRFAVVLAGGSGERFWPLSTASRPKQLLCLTQPETTMLEEAVQRIAPLVGDERVYVATSSSIAEAVRHERIVPDGRLLAEPTRRNTLGGLCWVIANLIARSESRATVAILTSDHLIGDPEGFRATVGVAMTVAERYGGIVTIGIRPTRPETGYGYIEADTAKLPDFEPGFTVCRSRSFREKPSFETAESFLSAGNFLWNGGMFVFTIPNFLRELERAQPEAHATTLEIASSLKDGNLRRATECFESLPSISVDYAVMERANEVFVVQAEFPWDDVGAWDALHRSFPTDENGNVVRGEPIHIDCRNSILVSDGSGPEIGAVDLREMIVVSTSEGILVCPKESAQRVREVAIAVANRRRHSEA